MLELPDLSGRQIGRYRVLSLLGAGGMGAVYEASDPDLHRVVALKILPPGLVSDGTRLQRFTQEARTASALNHPHVVSIHETGAQELDGRILHFIAMERVEGRTLRETSAERSLPRRKMLELMAQVADAMAAAHAAGIIHRDLKPENIMVTAGGYAKVLDFGLAKLREEAEASAHDAETKVLHTAEGAILGTIGYMAPEQAQGKAADARSDIFAIGCILYEAVTGRRAFKGSSAVDTLHHLIHDEPEPLQVHAPDAPPELRRMIRKTLAKDPDSRYQSAKDLVIDLRDLAREADSISSPSESVRQPVQPARQRALPLLLAAAAVAATALLTWFVATRRSSVIRRDSKIVLQVTPPGRITLTRAFEDKRFAISPDGSTISFVGADGDSQALYMRRLDSPEVRKLEGTEGAVGPFWSPDGMWIAYSARGRLWKTPATGAGSSEAVCDVPVTGVVGSWGRGTILFADSRSSARGIMSVADSGGKPVPATVIAQDEFRHGWPQWLDDGEHFVYTASAAASVERTVMLASAASGARTPLVRGALGAVPVGNDQLLYVRDGKLLAHKLDLTRRKMVGNAVPIASDVESFAPSGHAALAVSRNGVIVYRTDTSTGRLSLFDRRGVEVRLLDGKGPFLGTHAFSPDGRKAAVAIKSRTTGFGDIWIYDVTRAVRERLTSDAGMEVFPVWAPDGRSIVYSATPGGSVPFLVRKTIVGDRVQQLVPRGKFQVAGSFSGDGATVFYSVVDSQTASDLFRLDIATGRSTPIFRTPFTESSPQGSPSGRWLAFTSNESGTQEVYLHELPSPDSLRTRISTSGGSMPRWRGDGEELFYFGTDGRSVVSARPGTSGQWDNATVSLLFRVDSDIVGFDVSRDGQSFLISTGARGAEDASLHVILDAF